MKKFSSAAGDLIRHQGSRWQWRTVTGLCAEEIRRVFVGSRVASEGSVAVTTESTAGIE